MISNPVTGANYIFKALPLLNKPGIRPYVILPLLINTFLFAGLIWFLSGQFGQLVEQWMPNLPDWLSWLSWIIWFLFGITILVILFFSFTLLANLVGAPFNSYLSSAVENYLTGNKPETGLSLFTEVKKSLAGELKKILYFVLWAIPLFIISLIPGINFFSPFLWALFGAWMMSIEYADYPLGNAGLNFPEIRQTLRQKSILSLGFGGMVMLVSVIPLFNFMIMPVAVIAATIMHVDQFKKS
ncbi:MAG: sulfate transporter CysZ [Gammaproteobacteria bacterium]|nr:sulfate transporter CysZ [Gammaproteobacteria bacterium]